MTTAAKAARRAAPPRPRPRPADEGTRKAVLAAAIETICELGYYQASSNEIARKAGVSWGVIQYYFGSREALLLAALEDAIEEAITSITDVKIQGDDTRLRLRQLYNLVLRFYGRREYFAIMQIMWNLSRDPNTKQSTVDALLNFWTQLLEHWQALFIESIELPASKATIQMVFSLMWGAAAGESAKEMMDEVPLEETWLPLELRIEMLLDSIEGLLKANRS